MTVKLAIACQEIEAVVRFTPSRGLTHLEEATLGALLCGRDSVEDVGTFLGIGRRLAVDVIHGLWSLGHVTVDFSTGQVSVTDQGRTAQLDADQEVVGTIQATTRTFLHEPISGAVLSSRAASRVPEEALNVPRDVVTSTDDIARDQLLRLVQQEVDELPAGERPLADRVLDVSLGPRSLRRASRDRRVVVDASVRFDEAGRVRVRVLGPVLGDRSARLLEGHLEHLCDASPNLPFVQSLRAQARDQLSDQPLAAERLLEQVRAAVERTRAASEAGHLKEATDLIDADRTLDAAIARMEGNAAALTQVLGPDAVLDASEQLIDAARRQVVIAAPQLRYRGMNRLLPSITEALKREVRVVVMWGDRAGSELDTQLASLRADLIRTFGDRVVWSTRSGRMRVRALVSDGEAMLVGSSVVDGSGAGSDGRSVGLRVGRPSADAAPPEAIVGTLTLIRNSFPDIDLASAIEVDLAAGVEAEQRDRQLVEQLYQRTRDAEGDLRPVAVDAWTGHLIRREVAIDACRRGPSITVHRGAGSRSALLELLREDPGPVSIRSRRVHPAAIDAGLVDTLQNSAGMTPVHIGSKGLTIEDERLARIGDWRAVGEPVDASLLVTSRRTLLTTFDLLSDVASGATDAVGFVADDPALARILLHHLDGLADPAPEASVLARPDEPEGRLGPLLELASAKDRRTRVAVIDRVVVDDPDPFELLDRWGRSQADEILRRGAAVALRSGEDSAASQRWADWLVDDALRRGRYVEAAALAAAVAPLGTLRPATLLACCPLEGAWVDAGALDIALELDGAPPAEATVAVAGLAYELLFRPEVGFDGGDAIEMVALETSKSWQALAAAAVTFRRTCWAAVPIGYINDQVTSAVGIAERETEWTALHRTIDDMRQRRQRWSFNTGLAIHDFLFSEGGFLAAIDAAATGGDADRARVVELLPTDVRGTIDAAVHTRGEPPMAWSKHRAYLRDVEASVESARRLARAVIEGAEPRPAELVLRATEDLVRTLGPEAGVLAVEVETTDSPLGGPLRTLLRRLDSVLRWGAEVRV
jgi:hypothetical protein